MGHAKQLKLSGLGWKVIYLACHYAVLIVKTFPRILESNISVCEGHFDKTRATVNETTMRDEVQTTFKNGPVLVEAE